MKNKLKNILPILITLFLLLSYSCKKEINNLNPTIRFIQPQNNLIISQDSTIRFIVEPKDEDGTVKKVEFLINEVLIDSLKEAPFQFDWFAATMNHGLYVAKVMVFDNENETGSAEIDFEILSDYRDNFCGDFYFITITALHSDTQETSYDTTYYNGEIRKFDYSDLGLSMTQGNQNENPDEKITIQFIQERVITPTLSLSGKFKTIIVDHYIQSGGFINLDTLLFNAHPFGLGGGWNNDVIGIRK